MEDLDFGPTFQIGGLKAVKEGVDMLQLREEKVAEWTIENEDFDEEFLDITDDDQSENEESQERASEFLQYFDSTEPNEALESFEKIRVEMKPVQEDQRVLKFILKSSGGNQAPTSGWIEYHIVGFVVGEKTPFASTVSENKLQKCFKIQVDGEKPEVIPGLYVALNSMKMGEIAKFIVHPSLAFGNLGCPSTTISIPPNSEIFLLLMVVRQILQGSNELAPVLSKITSYSFKFGFRKALSMADELRNIGNTRYNEGHYRGAIYYYAKSVQVLEKCMVFKNHEEKQLNHFLFLSYNNLSQVYLKVKNYEKAAFSCRQCMQLSSGESNKTLSKFMYRYSQTTFHLGDAERAMEFCKNGLKMDPSNKSFLLLKNEIQRKLKEENKTSKRLFQKMLEPNYNDISG